ncbi:MAG: hypothetical protein A3F74_09365 [Betaproteobacteria bacterium RIFCSPLOWO2_12_FULL_62_58]|nr:MAG: hypothetical protein A3F74_09365 [Betaproteobacteria bacterium RIFCSPLOWO2_12_FULL_62_58]
MGGWRSVGVLVACISSIAFAADEPLAFKGLALGSSKKEVLKHYPRATCSTANFCIIFDSDPKASKGMSVAGVPAGAIAFNFEDGKVEGITIMFDAARFTQVENTVKKRYGAPDVVVPSSGETHMWRRSGGIIRLDQYFGSDRRDSALSYLTDAEVRRTAERLDARRRDASNDL